MSARLTPERLAEIRRHRAMPDGPGMFGRSVAQSRPPKSERLHAIADELLAELDAVTRERDEAIGDPRRNDTTRLDYLRANGMIRVAGAEGPCLLRSRVESLDALREAIDGYIDDDLDGVIETLASDSAASNEARKPEAPDPTHEVFCGQCGAGHHDLPGNDSTWRCRKCDAPLRRTQHA